MGAFLCMLECRAEGLQFIDTSFENASPLWYQAGEDGMIEVHLLYDHERSSPNRAAGHFHFQLQAKTGTELKLEFKNLDNVWNGRAGSVARELKAAVISEDGTNWTSVPTESFGTNRVRLNLKMRGPKLFVARVEPYRVSDLERWLERIREVGDRLVKVEVIGRTAEGRTLEIVRIGTGEAPYNAFVRARAHPWEAGGNWVVEGLVERLLSGDEDAKEFLKLYSVWIMSMANKDGVARGRTRFNARGRDLNRNWDQPSDKELAPENYALEEWLKRMIASGKKPHLALELHNDGGGLLHISRPPVAELERHLKRMEVLEALLRKHTWFTEGSTKGSFRNSGTLGDGWLERFGIDAAVHEFNCNWIASLEERPTAARWKEYGAGLAKVFAEYFAQIQP